MFGGGEFLKDKTLILLLTGMCALLGGANMILAVFFAHRGAWASVASSVTAVMIAAGAAVYGVWWLCHQR